MWEASCLGLVLRRTSTMARRKRPNPHEIRKQDERVSNGYPVEVVYTSSKTISILATVAPGFRLATVDRSFRSGLLCFQCQAEA